MESDNKQLNERYNMNIKIKLLIILAVICSLTWNAYTTYRDVTNRAAERVQNQAIVRGFGSVEVTNSKREFQWKEYQAPTIETVQRAQKVSSLDE